MKNPSLAVAGAPSTCARAEADRLRAAESHMTSYEKCKD